MKQLQIQYTAETDVSKISALLNAGSKQYLHNILWKDLTRAPAVSFSLLHDQQNIYIKYFVAETEKRAVVEHTNGPVWEDSCVEFFISLDKGKSYFNFEFNSLGTRLAGYGKSRTDRTYLETHTVESIPVKPDIINTAPGEYQWNLFVAIPIAIFRKPEIRDLRNKQFHANFYKCGDALQEPHFLSWSRVESKEPNFHLPEFFGEIYFS